MSSRTYFVSKKAHSKRLYIVFLVLNLKAFLLERMPWRQARMRKKYGSSGGTATRRFAVRASGSWRRMPRRARRKTATSLATTGV